MAVAAVDANEQRQLFAGFHADCTGILTDAAQHSDVYFHREMLSVKTSAFNSRFCFAGDGIMLAA